MNDDNRIPTGRGLFDMISSGHVHYNDFTMEKLAEFAKDISKPYRIYGSAGGAAEFHEAMKRKLEGDWLNNLSTPRGIYKAPNNGFPEKDIYPSGTSFTLDINEW